MAQSQISSSPKALHERTAYKWIALSNTTLGVLMAAINGSSLIIALPAVFRGIHVNPLATGQTSLLLWVLMGYNVATTILLLAFGRLSDSLGRVRLYNLGFAIFTAGSILLSLTWGHGIDGEWQLIIFRFVQGIGGAFLYANSTAILTDAFPPKQRGLALGLNGVAALAGATLGIVLGGLLAAIHWRAVFLLNVPFGLAGTIWAYIALKEQATKRPQLRMDWLGNLSFALGLLGVMLGLTYSIQPYGHHVTGWSSPFVLISLFGGIVLLIFFVVAEIYLVDDPMFHLSLFKVRGFALGNLSQVIMSLTQMGLQFMVIIWLQGIWLPLHGVSFANTPLQAGLDTLPMMVGFMVSGPFAGSLSDRMGARVLTTIGMGLGALGFLLLSTLPSDFTYWLFAFYIFLLGFGMGMFAAPNSAAVMNSVPPQYRGVASGMRGTFQNTGTMLSMGLFFTITISALSSRLPGAMTRGLQTYHLPIPLVHGLSHIPPVAALFAALLGMNPLKVAIPASILHLLPAKEVGHLVSRTFFPSLIASPFHHALKSVFLIGMALAIAGALAAALRGPRYIYDEHRNDAPTDLSPRLLLTYAVFMLSRVRALPVSQQKHAILVARLFILVAEAKMQRSLGAP